MTTLERETTETRVTVTLERGTGESKITIEPAAPTGVEARVTSPFLTHMLETFARYSGLDLAVEAEGDLEHHLVEDVAITLGRALRETVDVDRVQRVGHAYVPFDEALVVAAVDVVDRPYYRGDLGEVHPLWDHFLRSLAHEARVTLHVEVRRGRDPHHVVEGAVKATARALQLALAPRDEVLSTKGEVQLEEGP